MRRLTTMVVSFAVVVSLIALAGASVASAASPWWHVTSRMLPSNLKPGGEATVVVQAVDVGNATTSSAIDLSDVVPAGVSIQSVSYFAASEENGLLDVGPSGFLGFLELCKVTANEAACSTESALTKAEFLEPVIPFDYLEMRITVKAEAGAETAANKVQISGGGAPAASIARPLVISEAPPAFGVEEYAFVPEEEDGTVDARAGSHPYQLTTSLTLNQNADPVRPPALPRNLQFRLPPGLVGNATALPQCSDLDFRHLTEGGFVDFCPGSTAVGVASITVTTSNTADFSVPIFNLVPEKGEPARFGFEILGIPVTLDTSVRTGGDYGVTVNVSNITELASFQSTTVTLWGVPGDSSHDESRGWGCLAAEKWAKEAGQKCILSAQSKPPPFLTLPTSCSAPFLTTVEGTAWPTKAEPAGASFAAVPYSLKDSFGRELGITNCNQLQFDPSIEVAPDVQTASTPTGLKVDVHVPQEVSENAEGQASSNVKDITVALPEGVMLSPAGADGLEACSEGLVGYLPGERNPPGDLHFTPSLPGSTAALVGGDDQPLEPGVNFCPDASKIGTVKITSPLIANPVEGSVYLAAQNANPFGSLIAMYIVAEDPVSGVLVKLPGEVSLDPTTGQILTTFKNNPQLPFEDAELHFFGGSRAPLATPSHCGTYTTSASFAPWSGNESVGSQSSFKITSGPNGSACPGSLPFAPSLAAGMTNINAAAFSPLTTTISREDGNQNIQTVQLHMPPGLSGILAGVPLCGEAQANAGTCSQGSLIGHTIVSVGLGNEPFSVVGGEVFLTEGYAGAPFGLSIVNPAVAGPFNLGKVIVRAKIEVDPHTAALTVTTSAIPHILDGIPLQIKHVNVTIDRPGFTFNPTNCSPQKITGTIGSVEGGSAPVEVPFQVTNCANLKFAPKFSVSTSGKTSKANGASLVAKLSYPNAAQGTQVNLTRVKVDLPKQLPSRLTTLQKACTNKQFELNPANCPKESKIGFAKVTTPLLPVPLEGPAIFVSHGGEAFPSLTMVLQGAPPYGVTIDLVGTTFISKAGITSTTFKTVPDVPFNNFQLTLPQGKFSALAANGNLCKSKLAMPTEFLAQNGLKINQSTPIGITGCAKAKALTRPQKLTKALKTCHKKAKAKKRAGCEKQARKAYGPAKKKQGSK
jgi:hypothetical protein